MLGCWPDLPCVRGPRPVSLRELRTSILLLASCNGLRLADGALTPDFNLGFAFLDGPGRAYVSSISGTRGNEVASTIFLAAVSSGVAVGRATLLVNAALLLTGIDLPRFVAIGDPSFTAAPRTEKPDATTLVRTDADELEINAGNQHFAEVIVDDARTLALCQENALLLAGFDNGTDVTWFARPEIAAATDGTHGRRQLRLFCSDFRNRSERCELAVADRRDCWKAAACWLAALARWLELWRVFGLATREPEAYSEFRAAYDDASLSWSRLANRLAWSTGARTSLDAQCDVARALAQALAAELLPELTRRLKGSFWLPNETGASYQIEKTQPCRCDACGREGVDAAFGIPSPAMAGSSGPAIVAASSSTARPEARCGPSGCGRPNWSNAAIASPWRSKSTSRRLQPGRRCRSIRACRPMSSNR